MTSSPTISDMPTILVVLLLRGIGIAALNSLTFEHILKAQWLGLGEAILQCEGHHMVPVSGE